MEILASRGIAFTTMCHQLVDRIIVSLYSNTKSDAAFDQAEFRPGIFECLLSLSTSIYLRRKTLRLHWASHMKYNHPNVEGRVFSYYCSIQPTVVLCSVDIALESI